MNNDRVHQVYFGEEGDEATRILTRSRIHWVIDQVGEGRVLDLGCSQGVASVLMAERGASVIGVDNEPPAVEFARGVRENLDPSVRARLEFVDADGSELPFRAKSFDSAVCSEVLEHAQAPEPLVEELFRVLKPGGLLVVTVPFGVLPHPDHRRVFYMRSLEALLEPMFRVGRTTVLERHIGCVAKRRPKAKGTPSYVLSPVEVAFLEREEELRGSFEQTKEKLAEANLKYRNATGSLASLREQTAAERERLTEERAAEEQATWETRLGLAQSVTAAGLLNQRIEELKRDHGRLTRQLDASRRDAEALRQALGERERAASDAARQGESLEADLASTRAELDEARRELEDKRRQVAELNGRISQLEGKLEAGRDQLDAAVAELRDGRAADLEALRAEGERRRRRAAEERRRLLELERRQAEILDSIEARTPAVREALEQADQVFRLASIGRRPAPAPTASLPPAGPADEFELWRRRAAAAPGDEVVFMYSGTIFVQEKRGNRPIRLTRVYLDQERPVFFNYWRWREDEPGPEWGHPLLHQSPVDVTPRVLDRLLEADFGGKRKVMFASFPHELMIRALSRAAQQGWVTIYDARDDWEEFEKVGMAKWYDRGFEEYLVRAADVVTAVSEPLARKLCEMGDRTDITVVPNALEPGFPTPSGPSLKGNPPVVGYFGHLTPKWFDWDLIIRAARQHPDWNFELAGHQHPEDLELPPNVKLLGLLGHADLAELSRRWSFALVPFKVSALGEAVDPIKVYEYLHLGLPVLSSYMPQMRSYPGTVIAESAEDFLALMPEMAGKEVDREEAREWLRENTWGRRVARFSELARAAEARHREGRGLRSLLAYPYERARQDATAPRDALQSR